MASEDNVDIDINKNSDIFYMNTDYGIGGGDINRNFLGRILIFRSDE